MKKWICLPLLLVILSGCQEDIPKPESMAVKASGYTNSKNNASQKATIRHIVQNGNVFIECMVPNVTFSGINKKADRGKIRAYVDGQLKGEYYTAAFVMKGIPKGVHHIKIQIVSTSNKEMNLEKNFYVTV